MHGQFSPSASAVAVSLIASACAALSSAARGDINLEFRPSTAVVPVGETIEIGLWAVSDDPELNQSFAAMDVIIVWEPQYVQLIDQIDVPELLISSGFPPDLHGLNENPPALPQDGDGFYVAWAPPGAPIDATPAGTLIVTFVLEALQPVEETMFDIAASGGDPVGYTRVFSGTIPGLNVLGTISGTSLQVTSGLPCPADVNGDGVVDVLDLLAVIAAWGSAGGPEDVNADGVVDVLDLLAVIGAWGACP